MKTLLKGGTIVGASGSRRADILIENEIIAKIGEDLRDADARVVDCTGMLLFPGFIDAHTHFDLDVCNTTTADDFETGSRSALLGGTTTVIVNGKKHLLPKNHLIFILPNFFQDKAFAVFLAEPVSDIIAAAVTTFMFFRFFIRMLREGKNKQA